MVSSLPKDLSIIEEIQKTLKQDPLVKEVQRQLKEGKGEDFEFNVGLLFFRGILYVPPSSARLKVLQVRHDLPAAGHFGVNNTIELVSRDYWWPQLWKFVKEYIWSCDICSRAKGTCYRPYGLLQPLPIPNGPWLSLSLDFITDLPVTKTFNSILVVVD